MNPLSTVAPAGAFRHSIRVYFEDTDAAGIVYYANYLKFMERARTEWLRALDHPHAAMVQHDQSVFVVQAVQMQYIAPARLEEVLEIATCMREVGRASLTLDQWALRDGQCLVASRIRLGHVDTQTLRPKRIAPALARLLQAQLNAPAASQ
ncbi:MAG TPA: tol-pal system-associated acyl-CoA thioesterase [Burkholderiaceae bacterium]|nr:tol-pal system-associated acyl-CoA thioesterase [Burkholderiaceae bacterium]